METTTKQNEFLKNLQTAGILELERALKNVTELIKFYENNIFISFLYILSLYEKVFKNFCIFFSKKFNF